MRVPRRSAKRARASFTSLPLVALLLAACIPAPIASLTPTRTAAAPTGTATPAYTPTPQGAPDLNGERITLHHFCASTGELAAFNFTAIWAAQDMAAAINEAGGLFGAALDLQLIDTQGTAAGAEAAYTRLVNRDEPVLLILICDAISEQALAPLLARDGIPALGPGFASESAYTDPGGALFAYRSPLPQQFSSWLDFLSAHWSALKPAGAGDEIRLAFFAWPEELGGFVAEESVASLAEERGIELAQYERTAAQRTANIYDFVYAARDTNANAIYMNARAFTAAELLNVLHALGLQDRFTLAGPDVAFDGLDAYLLTPGSLDATHLTSNSLAWSATENAAVSFAQQLLLAHGREAEHQNFTYLHTLAAVDIARYAIEQALLAQGLDDLDSGGVRGALLALDEYAVLDGLYSLSYARSQRYPTGLHVYEFDAQSDLCLLVGEISP